MFVKKSMKHLITSLLCFSALTISTAQLPAGFAKYQIASGLNPTDLAIAPDGRVFITEKDGLVRIVANGQLLPDPFIILNVEDYNEQGLGHIALDPQFPAQPYVYLYYTVSDGAGLTHNQLTRVTADGNFAVPGSEVILYAFDPSPASVHNAGDIVFGADGKIYVGTGDKGRAFTVQTMETDLGKVIRINKDGSIPSDNPFYQTNTGKYRAIYALGLRNPFSMIMQPETGRLFFCDVGSAVWEEINEILPGKNYGYPEIEGLRSTQPAPTNYQDPFYFYDHQTGCAVVGAAFLPINNTIFPSDYNGKFFFGDYCKGFIKMLNPQNPAEVTSFATGISRPVAIAISPNAEFYYLARAGIGGGSVEDNTESENGSLWRIIYTGSDAPFVYAQPQGDLRVEGELITLKTSALGKAPLSYQWQKDGVDIPASNTTLLNITSLTLADSNTAYRCIVSNSYGQDTSETAIVRVTSNQRPILEITAPATSFRYKAGTYIAFSGNAQDPETGDLPASVTSWKIDFHHADHSHPVMTPMYNIISDSIYVPTVGEVDDDVWYQLFYTAKDPAGLSKTAFRNVFPQKTPVEVHCDEAKIAVNADGILGNTPYFFNSVAGLERSLHVPSFIDEGDSVLIFQHWDNGLELPLRPFVTPDTGTVVTKVTYSRAAKSNGWGLLGEYYHAAPGTWDFLEPLLVSRIDSMVNFEWLEGSPEPGQVPNENFAVRWTGQVVPYNTDTLTFYTATDDGARLWVNDSLLIDFWQPQGGTEHAGALYLEGGKKYRIRFEFLELGGVATAKLRWSTSRMPKEPVPSRQLFPPQYLMPNRFQGLVWLDTDANGLFNAPELALQGAALMLWSQTKQSFVAATMTDSTGHYTFGEVPTDTYAIQVLPPLQAGAVVAGFGLSPNGMSADFALEGGQIIVQDFAFQNPLEVSTPEWADRGWTLGPNPTSGKLTFRKKLVAYQEHFDIRVFDAVGKLCLEKTLAKNVWETELDLQGLAAGVYLVHAGGQVVKVTLL